MLKPVSCSSAGEVSDERFVQGDDYTIVCTELVNIENVWDRGDLSHLFISVESAKSDYLENYFLN